MDEQQNEQLLFEKNRSFSNWRATLLCSSFPESFSRDLQYIALILSLCYLRASKAKKVEIVSSYQNQTTRKWDDATV